MITCTFEDGGTGKLRHVVVDNIIIKDRSVLLVKRAAPLLEGGKWAFPAGFISRDETSTEAAHREALEETGWELKNMQLFMIKDNPHRPHEDRQNISLVFTSEASRKTGRADDESEAVQWFDLNNLPTAMAFDHLEILDAYKQHHKNPVTLPLFA